MKLSTMKYLGNYGDANPLEHYGYFVFDDNDELFIIRTENLDGLITANNEESTYITMTYHTKGECYNEKDVKDFIGFKNSNDKEYDDIILAIGELEYHGYYNLEGDTETVHSFDEVKNILKSYNVIL